MDTESASGDAREVAPIFSENELVIGPLKLRRKFEATIEITDIRGYRVLPEYISTTEAEWDELITFLTQREAERAVIEASAKMCEAAVAFHAWWNEGSEDDQRPEALLIEAVADYRATLDSLREEKGE